MIDQRLQPPTSMNGDLKMQKDVLNTVSSYSQDAMTAAKELIEINGRLFGKVLETQIGLANLCVEGSEKQIEASKDVSDVKDFMAKQTALVEEYAAKLSDAAQSTAKIAQESSEELKAWFEKGVKSADLAVKEAAKTATSAAA